MGRLIEEDEAKRVLGDYYHHKTEIQKEALQEAFSRIPTAGPESAEAMESYVSPVTMAVHDMSTQIVKEQERMLLKELRSLEIHVDKDELLKALAYDRNQYAIGYIDAINEHPAQRWIPCSERMPETTDEVLVTYIVNGNKKRRFVQTSTWYGNEEEGYWSSPWDEYLVPNTKIEVLAWVPLPKPYEVEE